MKYEISNKKKITGVILNLPCPVRSYSGIQNLIDHWIPNQVRDDRTAHISYFLFHISTQLKGAN